MLNNKSDYAINKADGHAIVYKTADGGIIRLTCEYFSSEEEFLRWKKWSDEEYRVEDNKEHENKKGTLSLDNLFDVPAAVPTTDEYLIAEEERDRYQVIVAQMRSVLSEKQFRRLWLHTVEKRSEAEIAALENAAQQNVSKSIRAAKKKFFIFFGKQGVK